MSYTVSFAFAMVSSLSIRQNCMQAIISTGPNYSKTCLQQPRGHTRTTALTLLTQLPNRSTPTSKPPPWMTSSQRLNCQKHRSMALKRRIFHKQGNKPPKPRPKTQQCKTGRGSPHNAGRNGTQNVRCHCIISDLLRSARLRTRVQSTPVLSTQFGQKLAASDQPHQLQLFIQTSMPRQQLVNAVCPQL